MRAGVKDEQIMFLFTDQQIFTDRCLVYMNDLLSSGNIPDLFVLEEQDSIISAITSRVKGAGLKAERKT